MPLPFLSRRTRSLALTLTAWAAFSLILFYVFLSDNGPGGISYVLTTADIKAWVTTPGPRGPNGEQYPPLYRNRLPKLAGGGKQLPRVQHDFTLTPETKEQRDERETRRDAVRERLVASWSAYQEHALGFDELKPISGGIAMSDGFGGWGATLFDSLDTLWLAGCVKEFELAVDLVGRVDFNESTASTIAQGGPVNIFEVGIRYLGGLLGAYDASGARYPDLLRKAIELGDWIYDNAYDTPNRMPVTRWRPASHQQADRWAVLAELGSLSLEFTRLSQLTGNGKYYDAVYRVSRALDEHQMRTRIPGLWPVSINARSLKFDHPVFTLGGQADSVYEYLPKMTALLGGDGTGEPMYRRMYERAIAASKKHLFFRPMLNTGIQDILVSGAARVKLHTITPDYQGEHLGCFTGGMVMLAAKLYGLGDGEVHVGRQLADGCVWAYDVMPNGIMPEQFHLAACPRAADNDKDLFPRCDWDDRAWTQAIIEQQGVNEMTRKMSEDEFLASVVARQNLAPGFVSYDDKRYGLRPEAIESVFYTYRVTGDRRHLDDAWRMWQNIDAATRTKYAHAELKDVTVPINPPRKDKMESFWLAETLKYFYLIFSEHDYLSLDRYVL